MRQINSGSYEANKLMVYSQQINNGSQQANSYCSQQANK
jgi:hypothetical protein